MKVIAFVGSSGTGKSYRALWVAKERGIDYIIDDGLLIHGNRIVAGKSAKKELTKIRSVKTALFIENSHKDDLIKAIEKNKVQSILILGTSEGMVKKIANQLKLPEISEFVYITDVASKYEIEEARYNRVKQGKHVIPVPEFELKKDFAGYFLHPLQIFRRKGTGNYQRIGEKTVVRPNFSYFGKYTISDNAIYQMSKYTLENTEGINKVQKYIVITYESGLKIDVEVQVVFGVNIKNELKKAQIELKQKIEELTSFRITELNITAKSIYFNKAKVH